MSDDVTESDQNVSRFLFRKSRYDRRWVCHAWQRQRRPVSTRRRWLRAQVVVSVARRRDTPHQTTDLEGRGRRVTVRAGIALSSMAVNSVS